MWSQQVNFSGWREVESGFERAIRRHLACPPSHFFKWHFFSRVPSWSLLSSHSLNILPTQHFYILFSVLATLLLLLYWQFPNLYLHYKYIFLGLIVSTI